MKRQIGLLEKAQLITNTYAPFNAVITLHLSNGPTEETLKKVLHHLRCRHPLLSAYLQQENELHFLETNGTPAIPLIVRERSDNLLWKEIAEEELNTKIDVYTGPLLRITYLRGQGREAVSDMVFTFQHIIIDAASGASFLNQLLVLCNAVQSGNPPAEPHMMELEPPADDLFPPSHKGTELVLKNARFILRQMGDELLFRVRSIGKRTPPIHAKGRGKILSFKLSVEVTKKLHKLSRKKRITINSLLNAGILIAVHKHLYNNAAQPMRNINFADLRPYLSPALEPDYLGSYFSMIRFTVNMGKAPEFLQLAERINEATYKIYKRGDKYCFNALSPLVMKTAVRSSSFRMGATALSYTGAFSLTGDYGKIKVRDMHAFVSNCVIGPEYTAQARLFDKQLCWDILYLDSDMNEEQAKKIATEIAGLLESSVQSTG
ncbi:MAG: hypothetical protein GY765_26985 [bacterium]|nr:hypothetical protein [bacterium]